MPENNQVDVSSMLGVLTNKKAREANENAAKAMVDLQHSIARGLTIDNKAGGNQPKYDEYVKSIAVGTTDVATSITPFEELTEDGWLVNKIVITTGANTSVSAVNIDDLVYPVEVAVGSTVTIDVKDVFGDFIYADELFEIVASNAGGAVEDVTVTVQGFTVN